MQNFFPDVTCSPNVTFFVKNIRQQDLDKADNETVTA